MRPIRAAALLAAATLATACGSAGTGTENAGGVALNVATTPVAASQVGTSSSTSNSETYITGSDTLVITSAEFVLREIELESAVALPNCTAGDDDDDDCEEIELAARLFSLPLGTAGAARTITVPVPAGLYDEVEFEVHKPSSGSSDDAAFLAANPDFAGVSVRVRGTWNGQPFTFTSDVEADYEIEFSPPLQVAADGQTDFTINVDVGTWFRNENGTLLNPATALKNQPNESRVRNNIQNSIRAFEDDDRDGRDDDGDDD